MIFVPYILPLTFTYIGFYRIALFKLDEGKYVYYDAQFGEAITSRTLCREYGS